MSKKIADLLGLTDIRNELSEISLKLDQINQKLAHIQMTNAELTAALTEAGDKLEKAQAEILAELEKLKAGGELSPEAQATVARIQSIAQALDDVVPDA